MHNVFVLAEFITGADDPNGISFLDQPVDDCDECNESCLDAELSAIPWPERFGVELQGNIEFRACSECRETLRSPETLDISAEEEPEATGPEID